MITGKIFSCWGAPILGLMIGITTSSAASDFDIAKRVPNTVTITTDSKTIPLTSNAKGIWNAENITVTTSVGGNGIQVLLESPSFAVKHLHLSWHSPAPAGWKYLGDAWERAYGDLQWKTLDAKRVMPWYFLMTDGRTTHAIGVKTAASALCSWQVDANDITLDADVRSGGVGVELGNRKLNVCTILSRIGKANEPPFQAAQAFCHQMCPKPRMPAQPVYGFNDWYCSYGNSTAQQYLENAGYIVSLAPKGGNRPFAVIDDGWEKTSDPAGTGFWDGTNPRFGTNLSMAQVAGKIRDLGAHPGIWVRPLIASPNQPKNWRLSRDSGMLDPTVPEVRAYVKETMTRLSKWGYQLIKHDYTTFDICGHWGFEMQNGFLTKDGWAFSDRTHTTAEVILNLYRDIRESAGNKTIIIGCNTIGHLGAGLFELQRVGDDTSGKEWERTRKMGVNCVAFRAPQQGTFFAIDGDCAGQVSANSVPWEKNRQWLDLLARSGTPLFVSFPKASVDAQKEEALRAALKAASKRQPLAQPLDWLDNINPSIWKMGNNEVHYTW